MNKGWFLGTLGLLGVAATASAVPLNVSGWQSYNGHAYALFQDVGSYSWTSAQSFATTQGGYLATVTSQGEDSFIRNLSGFATSFVPAGAYGLGPWLGGSLTVGASKSDSRWYWENGEGAFADGLGNSIGGAYNAWMLNPPTPNGWPQQVYLTYTANLAVQEINWDDVQAGLSQRSFIVERVPEGGTTLALFGLALSAMGLWRRR